MNWKNGTIDAHQLPNGTFVSSDINKKHVDIVRNNTVYREKLEQASKIAGYIPPVLTIARGGSNKNDDIKALMNQNKKAEELTKERNNEKLSSGIITVSR